MKNKICAVVVTYNRKQLLLECIESLIAQTYKLDKIYIIDNNSSDGTYELLENKKISTRKDIQYLKLDENIGGAGGFYEGIKEAIKGDYNWVWIMDDDTIPMENALEELVKTKQNIKEKISFLASCALDTDQNHQINHGKINIKTTKEGYFTYREYLENGAIELETATFVSLLINADAIKKCGLPVRDYFIWCDDIEYTKRLTKYYGKAYQIGKSKVIHKRKGKITNSIKEEENENKLKFWFYMLRNNLINVNEYEHTKIYFNFLKYQINAINCLINPCIKYGFKKFIIYHKSICAFIFKKYDYKAFKNRLDINVKYGGKQV